MEEIIKKETMTSLEIATVTGKQHQHVLRDIDSLLAQGVDASNFGLTSYTDKSNRQQRCYSLTKKGCLITRKRLRCASSRENKSIVGKNWR